MTNSANGTATNNVAPALPRRGAWDFTDAQRIVLSLLLWLNIIMLTVGYLALTGQVAL